MKIAILGGGFTGLTASYYLAKKGHEVTLFEKEKILGGLASGFKEEKWDWYLERTYHHLFSNDYSILNFAHEVGFENIIFRSPQTASLYEVSNRKSQSSNPQFKSQNYSTYPLDSPQDLLRFPLLSFPQKLRAGLILAFLKFSPYFSFYEKLTAQQFLQKSMGNEAWKVLWQELFREKFGKYAGNILASFIWARIKKRTKKLGYIEGGFQTFIDYLEEINREAGVKINKDCSVSSLKKQGKIFQVSYQGRDVINHVSTNPKQFDAVISTLPTPVLIKLGEEIFPDLYLSKLKKINYLHAVTLILETKQPVLDKTYWLNICSDKLPLMVVCQHTNFMDKKNYGGNHLAYLGWYVEMEDRKWRMEAGELLKFVSPHLQKISNYKLLTTNYYLFKGPFAQPIFDKEFINNKPEFETPVKNFYIANLDMTYPYDRGTNYAVKLGKQIANLVLTY